MAEALYLQDGNSIDWTPTAAVTAGEILQISDGRAGFAPTAIGAGIQGAVQVTGLATVAKTATMVMLKGSRVWWDHSANAAHLLQVNDKDFFLGTVQEDAASAATTVIVSLNSKPPYTVSLGDGFISVPVLTAAKNQAIIGHREGVSLIIDATAEAQKVDALSIRGVAVDTPCIAEALICVNDNGGAALDVNIGLASATDATSADTIAESLFCHIDGNDLNIFLESDDGSTEVAADDSLADYVVGTPFLVQWDLRDWADVQVYINGVNYLPAVVFDIEAATGPLKCLAHMEKTLDASLGNVTVMRLGIRAFEE